MVTYTAKAEDISPGDTSDDVRPSGGKVVQVVTACDGRKKVIVEGCNEGEAMPEQKARKVAELLMMLMKFCEDEIVAKLPKAEMSIQLSLNGMPYISVRDIEEIPLVLVHGGKSHTEREKKIWAAEMDNMITEGYALFHNPGLGKNGISCDMCHPDASNTHPETYPKYQTQMNKAVLLRDMINWCIANPMEGDKLAEDDTKMKAIEAYILSARAGKILEPGKH
jgi:thiosulfate dehydrogenase